jgi:hypothetical protein
METLETIRIRHYEATDYLDILSWWEARNAVPMPPVMIPASSCVACDEDGRPAAFIAIFLCNSNHVAFAHGLVMRPGLSMRQAKELFRHLEEGIAAIMRAGGHTHLIGTVENRAGTLRAARILGFAPVGSPMQTLEKLVKPLTT